MADFTQVKASLWQDPEFEQLTPAAKLVWLDLLTTPTRNTAGLYPMTIGRLAFETGLDAGMVEQALQALTALQWLEYDRPTGVVWIRKFIKRQPWGPTIRAKVIKDLQAIGMGHPLVQHCYAMYREILDTPPIPHDHPTDTQGIGSARGDGDGDGTGTGTGTGTGQEEEGACALPSTAAPLLAFSLATLPASESTADDYQRVIDRHTQRLPRSQIERIILELAEWHPKKPRAQLHLTLNKWLAKEQPEVNPRPYVRGGRRESNADRAFALVHEIESEVRL